LPGSAENSVVRLIAFIAVTLACATTVAAQVPDAASERSRQKAGESGAATSHTITPGGTAEPHEITGTATGSVSLSAEQRKRLKDYFAQPGHRATNQAARDFTISVGAAVPREVALQPVAPALAAILPTYKGDQYVVVRNRLVIATPDRRIVAIIPDVSG
jgi:hypothetical protein